MLLVVEAPLKKLMGPAIGGAMLFKKRLCCRLSLPRTSSKNRVCTKVVKMRSVTNQARQDWILLALDPCSPWCAWQEY